MSAVQPSTATRRAILQHALGQATKDVTAATQVLDASLEELGVQRVPDDPGLYELLVRAYIAPRLLRSASINAVQTFVDVALRSSLPNAAGSR